MFAIGGSVSNSMFIGFPILNQVLPEVAGPVLVMCVLVENIVVTPVGLFVAESRAARASGSVGWTTAQRTLERMGRNPMLVAVLLGAVLSVLPMTMPSVLLTSLDMLAGSAAALA